LVDEASFYWKRFIGVMNLIRWIKSSLYLTPEYF